jgi:HemY protein
MRRVISFLVVAAILVAFAWWMAELPGSVSVNVGTINMSAPTPVALLAALVLFLVVYIIVRLLALVFRLPSRTRRLRAMRNRDRGDTAVTRTLLALAGGDPDTARREAQRSRLARRHAAYVAALRLRRPARWRSGACRRSVHRTRRP